MYCPYFALQHLSAGQLTTETSAISPISQGDGKLYYGIYVQNGRLKGDAKKALRAVIEKYELPVTLTPHQNIILREIEPAWKADIMATLAAGATAAQVVVCLCNCFSDGAICAMSRR